MTLYATGHRSSIGARLIPDWTRNRGLRTPLTYSTLYKGNDYVLNTVEKTMFDEWNATIKFTDETSESEYTFCRSLL